MVGLLFSRGKYLAKMNDIRQIVWPQSHTLQKLGPGQFRAPNTPPPFGRRSGSNMARMFPLSRGMLVANFIAVAQSWPIPSHRTQISGAITPFCGGWGPPLGRVCYCTGIGNYQKLTQSVHASGQGSPVTRTDTRTFSR